MFRTDLLDQPSILDEYSKVSGVKGLKCKMYQCNCIMIGYVLMSPRALYAKNLLCSVLQYQSEALFEFNSIICTNILNLFRIGSLCVPPSFLMVEIQQKMVRRFE